MQVLSPEDVAKWFQGFEDFEPESRYVHIGYRIVESMNAGAGQPRAFEVAAGHRFRADELSDAIGMLMQPMIFAWDSFYLPSWSHGAAATFSYM
jgi:hypothetical protein